MIKFLIPYYVFINAMGFMMMGWDKRQARRKQWRISERALLFTGLAGGAIGTASGMALFHHKTKRWYFKAVFSFAILAHLVIVWLLIP
ncbi:DUF1294 domain-containing protein [Candidatus Formimonas warabiya]|uniref:DUF1294 domain-containing protein n=1 Tax=Formimonas warabiya TaxID=1761012 RepID=A0A3G1KTA8_FORW1|nr:DUF1294 domain-containing protein [Candidatus Formimonas warabiya]ATW25701.1 hypothetical protein DCMF_13850 [Candidatus Formimonas warabiya]